MANLITMSKCERDWKDIHPYSGDDGHAVQFIRTLMIVFNIGEFWIRFKPNPQTLTLILAQPNP